jgi:hypothetical protein
MPAIARPTTLAAVVSTTFYPTEALRSTLRTDHDDGDITQEAAEQALTRLEKGEPPVCTENLSSDVVVVKSAKDGA